MEPKAKYPTFRESGGHFSATKQKSEQQRTSITVLKEQLGGISLLYCLRAVGGRQGGLLCLTLCASPTGKDTALPGVGLPHRPATVGALIGRESWDDGFSL